MKTASYTVMLTDIKGFTERTSRQTREENERLLRLHDGLLSPVLRAYRGRRVKSLGDAYLVIFDSATRAIACGAAIQDRLAQFNLRAAEGDRIFIRIAISAGELRIEGEDVFGEAVNIASRVETRTDAGEVCFTEAALLLSDRGHFDYEELGPQRFKGVAEPVRLYRLRPRPEGPPYGGELLDPLRLPPPDPVRLARRRLPMPRHGARWIAGSLLLLLLSIGFASGEDRLWGPLARVERLAERGETGRAEGLLATLSSEKLTPAKIEYLQGRILEAGGDREGAVGRYLGAARGDANLYRQRIAPRLLLLLEDATCEVRSLAARALGELRTRSAIPALRALAAREIDGVGGLGIRSGCDPGGDARRAMEKMGAQE